jgi:hypothetical protein
LPLFPVKKLLNGNVSSFSLPRRFNMFSCIGVDVSAGDVFLDKAVERLRERLPYATHSWLRKAVKRLGGVKELGFGHYAVEGSPELGDRRLAYYVWLENGQWRCTCQTVAWGRACTHIGAVLLYREHRRLFQKAERHRVYVAEAEVECPGKVEASGEVYVKPIGGWRHRVLVVSHLREIKIKCSGHVIYETEGEEMSYAAALATVKRFQERKKRDT